MSHGDGGTLRMSPLIVVARCPECGYTEVVEDGSWLSPRSLSDEWCGHDREAFTRFGCELRNNGVT